MNIHRWHTRICLPNILSWFNFFYKNWKKKQRWKLFMFLKVAIVPAEATADGFKHFRLITSVHASLFITVYLSLCWKRFLNATDSGKIAYSTNQNREMKENILRYIFLKVQFLIFWDLNFSRIKFSVQIQFTSQKTPIYRIKMVSAKTTSFRVQVGRMEGGNCSNVNSMRGNVPYSKFHS